MLHRTSLLTGAIITVALTGTLLTGCTAVGGSSTAGGDARTSVATLAPSTGSGDSASMSASAGEPTTVGTSSTSNAPSTAVAVPASYLSPGTESAQVRDLQARLTQLQLLKGSIDGIYGKVTQAAVSAYQTSVGLPATGSVDTVTWERLVGQTHAPTARELDPPLMAEGSTGSRVRELQARLKQQSLWSGDVTSTYGPQTAAAVRSFQTKRGLSATGEVDRGTWSKLISVTRPPTYWELNNTTRPANIPAGLDDRCLYGRVICASKAARKIYWVIDGKIVLTLDARFGRKTMPTDNGNHTIYAKVRDAYSYKYDAPMPYALFFNGGEAVHYSPEFASIGYSGVGSHGCVNIRDKARMIWLFDQARVGDRVVVY